jgi:hypothetical protein
MGPPFSAFPELWLSSTSSLSRRHRPFALSSEPSDPARSFKRFLRLRRAKVIQIMAKRTEITAKTTKLAIAPAFNLSVVSKKKYKCKKKTLTEHDLQTRAD